MARGRFPMLEFSEGPLIQPRYGPLRRGWQAKEKPAAQGVWGAKQETWLLVLGPMSLSDLGPVLDFSLVLSFIISKARGVNKEIL